MWSLAYFFVEILVCGRYPETLWKEDGHEGSCVNQTWLNFTYAVTDSVLDIAVVSMPYPALRKLHLNKNHKVGIAAIFLLGTT